MEPLWLLTLHPVLACYSLNLSWWDRVFTHLVTFLFGGNKLSYWIICYLQLMRLFLQSFTLFKTLIPISKDQLFPFLMAVACCQCLLSGLGHCYTFFCHIHTGGQDLMAPQPVKACWWVPFPIKNSISVSLIWLVQGLIRLAPPWPPVPGLTCDPPPLTLPRLSMRLDLESSFTSSYLTYLWNMPPYSQKNKR